MPYLYIHLHPDSLPDTQPDRPSLKEIVTELNAHDQKWNVEINWFDIGIQLDINDDTLRYIRHSNHDEGPMGAHHDDRSFRDMIAEWLKQKSPSITWLRLVNALKLSNCPEFADQLRSKYCKCKYLFGSSYHSNVMFNLY